MSVTAWLMRLTFVVHAAMAVAQPVLAGAYLSGSYDVLGTHGLNGGLLVVASMACGAAAVAHAVVGGRLWPVGFVVVMFFAEGLQIGFGYGRQLAVHIPLGVAIVAASVAMAWWTLTPAVRRPRRRLRARGRAGTPSEEALPR